jgi:hypothetical protein
MTIEGLGDDDRPTILHCFADYGVESEVLDYYGDVLRVGIDVRDTNESVPVQADAHVAAEGKETQFPIAVDVTFDLGVFHPVCSKWASTTSISGDPDEHENMVPSARAIADEYCRHFVIENVTQAPLQDPIVLEGRMFGMPIQYRRGFETNFPVPQPPVHKRFWTEEGGQKAETSSFFYTERSRTWWASAKHVPPGDYPKQHLAKNTIPAQYVHHVCRAWLAQYEEEEGIGSDIDYSDYDERMDRQLDDFAD